MNSNNYNSPVGMNGTSFGASMNGSSSNPYSNNYNSMYGGLNGLPSPHSNLNNRDFSSTYAAKNAYGLQSPYAAGGLGSYSPYKHHSENNLGMWNNHRRPGSDPANSPLRRRLSI